jgi:N-acetyl-gamma-glutamyl-phosphate reductase
MKASIIGTTGYGGAELLRILQHHPYFQIQSIHSTRGEAPVSNEYPHLLEINRQTLEGINIEKISEQSDVVFLAAPSGASGQLACQFAGRDIKVIDLSGDLRLPEDQYKTWYKKDPADVSVIEKSVYGLSEWNREKIEGADIIANPGCYPTAALLGLAPALIGGLIKPQGIIIDAKSGISGAGRSPSIGTMFAEMSENFKIYKVNEHQHTPEIEQQLKLWNKNTSPITFSTHLIPAVRGIMATMYGELEEGITAEEAASAYREAYEAAPFVRVRQQGQFPATKEVTGSNYCDIGLSVDKRTGRLTIVAVIDNLMKGAAGQAVQNANLMFGLPEKAGLEFIPVFP